MNTFRAFMELDKLYESTPNNTLNEGLSRQELITNLKALGKKYHFDRYSDAQLFRMWERAEAESEEQKALKDSQNAEVKVDRPTCKECGQELTDGGFCPTCYDGVDNLEECKLTEIKEIKADNEKLINKICSLIDSKFRGLKIINNNKTQPIGVKAKLVGNRLNCGVREYIFSLATQIWRGSKADETLKDRLAGLKAELKTLLGEECTVNFNLMLDPDYEYSQIDSRKPDLYFAAISILSNKLEDPALLDESKELSNEHAVVSVVDRIKSMYEAGLFDMLPVGRDRAFTADLAGPDKDRLVSYFSKQSEFNYELHSEQNIISHEFISDKFDIEIFDSFIQMYKIPQNESLNEWTIAGGSVANSTNNISNSAVQAAAPAPAPVSSISKTDNVVTIVYDRSKGKLRARADDGIHGEANVAFPNSLRNQAGQQYQVDQLIWNGKNYRAVGNITPINNTSNAQNVNENITEEINDMNFQTILEELDKLYGEDSIEEAIEENAEKSEEPEVTEACKRTLTEDEDILIDEESAVDDEAEESVEETPEETDVDELRQLVLECSKCGAVVLKSEPDVQVDEATDLANISETCAYCDEAEGYKIIGTLAPYIDPEEATEQAEDLEEFLDVDLPISANVNIKADGNDVSVLSTEV